MPTSSWTTTRRTSWACRRSLQQGARERKVLVDQLARRDAEVEAANAKAHALEVKISGLTMALECAEAKVGAARSVDPRFVSAPSPPLTSPDGT